jgi:alanine racemase
MTHPAWIEIDTAALAHNARVIRRALPDGTQVGILVKANGYGHGAELAARAALDGGADQLMVANLDEALALRRVGIEAPVLVLYPIEPAGVGEAVAARIELSVGGVDSARRTLEAFAGLGDRAGELRLHVEVDSGIGRGGIPLDGLVDVVRSIDGAPGVDLVGVWTHLADACDPAASAAQIQRYDAALAEVASMGRAMPLRHVAATEGVFVGTSPAYDMVRIGLGYYGELGVGVSPSPSMASLAAELRLAMTVKARPIRLESMPAGSTIGYGSEWTAARASLVATLPIGYADGWSRTYWPGAEALVHGRRVPLIGRVSMDSLCADVTDVGEVAHDDEFILLGTQGEERITASDLARLRGTVTNEVFCDFGPRLERRPVG